jgi:hypothetical protein
MQCEQDFKAYDKKNVRKRLIIHGQILTVNNSPGQVTHLYLSPAILK